jgi:hypothetical protein
MKKLIISICTVLVLATLFTVPALAQDVEQMDANVTVTEYINLTITDPGTAGVNFGSISAGSIDVAEVDQNGAGAVTLTVHNDTNVDCNIQIKASDNFSDGSGHEFLFSNAAWDTDNAIAGSTNMTLSYATMDTSTAYTQKIVDVWHWISIPSDQYAATYSTIFYYQAIKQ